MCAKVRCDAPTVAVSLRPFRAGSTSVDLANGSYERAVLETKREAPLPESFLELSEFGSCIPVGALRREKRNEIGSL